MRDNHIIRWHDAECGLARHCDELERCGFAARRPGLRLRTAAGCKNNPPSPRKQLARSRRTTPVVSSRRVCRARHVQRGLVRGPERRAKAHHEEGMTKYEILHALGANDEARNTQARRNDEAESTKYGGIRPVQDGGLALGIRHSCVLRAWVFRASSLPPTVARKEKATLSDGPLSNGFSNYLRRPLPPSRTHHQSHDTKATKRDDASWGRDRRRD